MGFVGVVGKAAWLTAISLLVVLVSAVVPSNSAGALADHGDLAEGFVYDALVDIAEIPNVGPAGPMAPAVSSEGAVAPLAGTSGHVYDPNASPDAPNSTRIFRSVEPDELADLIGSGQYRNIDGIGEGKYFFPTEAQAENFAALMTKPGRGPYCTTSGCIPDELMAQVDVLDLPVEGTAYFIPEELLPYIDDIVIHGG